MFHIIVRSHFGSITCRLVLPPSAMSEYTVAVQAVDVWDVEAEWTFDNPPDHLVPLWKYYEWKSRGWHCKMCNQPATRGHTGAKKHTNMVWREQQKQGALNLGYTAARGGGDGGSWAAVGAPVGNGAAGSSGGTNGGASWAASPAIAAVGTQQQLDRMEAAIERLGTQLEKMREQLARLELANVLYQ